MEQEILQKLQRLYNVTHIPVSLLDGQGNVLTNFPKVQYSAVNLFATAVVLDDFRAQGRDALHPLISFIEPGFFLGVLELNPDRFILVGLVSPLPRARSEVLRMVTTVAKPEHLQALCDLILQLPLVTLDQMKDHLCLLSDLVGKESVCRENIRLMDLYPSRPEESDPLEQQLFEQRETAVPHVPIDFETALCNAIELGSRVQLEQRLSVPAPGQAGRMSSQDLQQEKYLFISLATLVSRAAIRGGLPTETAFTLSDLYCQRIDALEDVSAIRELCGRMMLDYCDRVREIRQRPAASPVIQRCLAYISVHLHEPISLSQLSEICGLCTRSLSLRFKAEMNMTIGDYIHLEKLKEAEYLLRHTDYSLSQIANYLNYSSQSYFTRIFREHRGMTPQQYRSQKE